MKNLVKYIHVIAFFALVTNSVLAQNADTLIFQSRTVRSVGGGFPTLNYPLLSPLNHSGYSIGFISTRLREKPEYLSQFQTHFEMGSLYNYANDLYITTLKFNGALSRHWQINDNSTRPLSLFFGGTSDIGLNIFMKDDNTNNPLAYFFNISVSPGILAKYQFNINNSSFVLGQQIDIPFVSLVSTSDYSSSLPPPFLEKEANFFEAMRLVSVRSLQKCVIITTLEINTSLQQRKKFPVVRINYIFTGMNYKNRDLTIKSADHLIVFGVVFYLFR